MLVHSQYIASTLPCIFSSYHFKPIIIDCTVLFFFSIYNAIGNIHSIPNPRHTQPQRLRRPCHRRYAIRSILQRQALTLERVGNSGIGYETTLQLALHGARVYIAGRSPDRMKKAMEQMKASNGRQLDLHMLEMDLQSLVSVKKGAEAFMKQESRLDILINNAGV